MKINELSTNLGVKNKELITFLKESGFDVVSHMQAATEDMIVVAEKHFKKVQEAKKAEEAQNPESKDVPKANEAPSPTPVKKANTRKFNPDDMIMCKSVTPWKLNAESVDKQRIYHWEYWGVEEAVAYKDLQAWRRRSIITKPKILIEDPDLIEQWHREIGETYKPFIGVDYPEQMFEMSNDDFEKFLRVSNETVREIVKTTAVSMIKAENYPETSKLKMIDEITGTNLIDFLS